MAKIFLKFNQAVIKEIQIDKDVVTFGRKEGNDIVIDSPAVSGSHGKIIKEGDAYFVEDSNSTNGTYINGRRVKKDVLKNKDQIRVARHVLEFVTDDETSGPAASAPQSPPSLEGLAKKEIPSAPPLANLSPKPPAPVTNVVKVEIAPQAARITPPDSSDDEIEKPASIHIISGAADERTEIPLKDLVTYIGTAPQALIKIKGFMVPSLAAAISRKKEGYFLNAVKPGYPKVNGVAVNQSVLLESGAMLEIGGTNMVFYLTDDKKNAKPA